MDRCKPKRASPQHSWGNRRAQGFESRSPGGSPSNARSGALSSAWWQSNVRAAGGRGAAPKQEDTRCPSSLRAPSAASCKQHDRHWPTSGDHNHLETARTDLCKCPEPHRERSPSRTSPTQAGLRHASCAASARGAPHTRCRSTKRESAGKAEVPTAAEDQRLYAEGRLTDRMAPYPLLQRVDVPQGLRPQLRTRSTLHFPTLPLCAKSCQQDHFLNRPSKTIRRQSRAPALRRASLCATSALSSNVPTQAANRGIVKQLVVRGFRRHRLRKCEMSKVQRCNKGLPSKCIELSPNGNKQLFVVVAQTPFWPNGPMNDAKPAPQSLATNRNCCTWRWRRTRDAAKPR